MLAEELPWACDIVNTPNTSEMQRHGNDNRSDRSVCVDLARLLHHPIALRNPRLPVYLQHRSLLGRSQGTSMQLSSKVAQQKQGRRIERGRLLFHKFEIRLNPLGCMLID